jgi:hypothetical protein
MEKVTYVCGNEGNNLVSRLCQLSVTFHKIHNSRSTSSEITLFSFIIYFLLYDTLYKSKN